MKKAVEENPESYTASNRGRTKQIEYDGIKFQGKWELEFYMYCKTNNIQIERPTEWFEYNWNGTRKYFPDFYIKVKNNLGKMKKYIIEIKPKKQTIKPTNTPKKRTKTWINEVLTYEKNLSKWKSAEEFCRDNLMEFKIITEDDLGL
jgi:hypothetical protein